MTISPAGDVMEERLHSHYESLQRVIGFVRLADAKAAPIIALQVALVGTLAARFDRLQPIVLQSQWGWEQIVLIAAIALYLACLVAVIIFAALVYIPRNPTTGDESLIYFEDIAAMPRERFAERAAQAAPEEIERQLIDQIYRVSEVVSVKMRRVRCAFVLSAPASVLWVVLLVWGSIQPEAPTMAPLP